MMLFDTHCHLDYIDGDIHSILENSLSEGVVGCVNICLRTDEFLKMRKLTENLKNIWYTVGNHPTEEFAQEIDFDLMQEYASFADVVAVGEIGLDYYHKNVSKEEQIKRFERQVLIAKDLSKPVVIHCRDALTDVLAILRYFDCSNFVMHCFTGGPEDAELCLDQGAYISYSGIVTFKNAKLNQEAARITPLNRLLIETDSPYLAPVPFRGKQNYPGMVKYVAQKISEIKVIDFENIAEITTNNACEFFGVKLSDQAFV